jgi:protein regulator of cytokinesis 1
LGEEKNDLKRLLQEDVTEISSCGLPLYTLQVQIDESLKTLREKLDARRSQIDEFLLERDQLCEELDEEKRELKDDPLPSEDEMRDFRIYLDALNEEKFTRLDDISNIRKDIKNLLQHLEIHLLEEYDDNLINGRCLQPTNENISKLRMLHDQFSQQFEEMTAQIAAKRKKIDSLWNYLTIPENHRNKFAKYTELTQTTYSILSQELERCEQIKRENIKIFIEKVREQLLVTWDKCLKSEQERARFTAFHSNAFTEDLLALHEMELEELTIFYEENHDVFKLLKERQDLLDRMEILEQKANDPNRYNNRGGGLLKEEKERKTINANLPKVEAKLLELVEKYNDSHRHPFTVFGESVQAIIDREWEKRKQDKITKSGKKLMATPARTPGRSTTLRTPAALSALKTSTTKNMTGVRKQLQLPSSSTSKMSATSSTVSSAASIHTSTGKRRLGTPANANPSTKRALVNAFKSPAPRIQTPRNVGGKILASNRSPLMPHNFGANLKIVSYFLLIF